MPRSTRATCPVGGERPFACTCRPLVPRARCHVGPAPWRGSRNRGQVRPRRTSEHRGPALVVAFTRHVSTDGEHVQGSKEHVRGPTGGVSARARVEPGKGPLVPGAQQVSALTGDLTLPTGPTRAKSILSRSIRHCWAERSIPARDRSPSSYPQSQGRRTEAGPSDHSSLISNHLAGRHLAEAIGGKVRAGRRMAQPCCARVQAHRLIARRPGRIHSPRPDGVRDEARRDRSCRDMVSMAHDQVLTISSAWWFANHRQEAPSSSKRSGTFTTWASCSATSPSNNLHTPTRPILLARYFRPASDPSPVT